MFLYDCRIGKPEQSKVGNSACLIGFLFFRFFFFFLSLKRCYVYVCGSTYATTCLLRSEDSVQGSVFPFQQVGSWDRTQAWQPSPSSAEPSRQAFTLTLCIFFFFHIRNVAPKCIHSLAGGVGVARAQEGSGGLRRLS